MLSPAPPLGGGAASTMDRVVAMEVMEKARVGCLLRAAGTRAVKGQRRALARGERASILLDAS